MVKIQFEIAALYVEERKYIHFTLAYPKEIEGKQIHFVRIEGKELTKAAVEKVQEFKVGNTIEITDIDLDFTNIRRPDQAGNLIIYEGCSGKVNKVENEKQKNQTEVLS